MSTNYYLHPADGSGGDEGIHLGKSTLNDFCFRGAPDRGIVDYPTWEQQLKRGTIYDEYGVVMDIDEMIRIAARFRPRPWAEGGSKTSTGFVDNDGRRFTTVEFC